MDDGCAHGDASEVFPAAVRFILDVLEATGCRVSAVDCYSPDYDLSSCPHCAAAADATGIPWRVSGVDVPSADGGPSVFRRGLQIMGASIGEPEYESYMLDGKVQKAISQVDDTVRRLSVSCASSLGSLLY